MIVTRPQVWYFVFCPDWVSNKWSLWRPFTSKGYRHVFGMHFDAEIQRWLLFEPNERGIFLGYTRQQETNLIFAYMTRKATTVLEYEAPSVYGVPQRLQSPITPYNCVTAMRHVARLNKVIFTVKGLHDALLDAGAQAIDLQSED